jgi:Domain of unknown function (DUF6456)
MASKKILRTKEEYEMQCQRVERPFSAPESGISHRRVTVNIAESPISWLRSRGLLSPRQIAAGEKLRIDYEQGGLPQRTTMAWDAPPTGKVARGAPDHGGATLWQIDARRRFSAAVGHAGNGLSDILWRVVCAGESVPVAEKNLGWPSRSGRLVLALALDRVADYYRIA